MPLPPRNPRCCFWGPEMFRQRWHLQADNISRALLGSSVQFNLLVCDGASMAVPGKQGEPLRIAMPSSSAPRRMAMQLAHFDL